MTYALSAPLQAAVYQQLRQDVPLESLVGDNVFDALPHGTLPPLYVSLGPEKVRAASDVSGAGAWHEFTVSVVSENAGFQSAKEAAGAVSDTLHETDLALSRGRLVLMQFLQARATLESGGLRRIDLSFRARVEDD